MASPAARRSAVGRAEPATGLLPVHPTHYERLGVPDDASAAQIDAAWQRLQSGQAAMPPALTPSLVLPGTLPSAALDAAAVRLAYDVLRDGARRAVYDAWLQREAASAAAHAQRRRGWRRPGVRRVVLVAVVAAAIGAGLWWWLSPSGAY